jgi:hypothetical protein
VSITSTPRFGLTQWGADSDTFVTRTDLDDDYASLEALAAQSVKSTAGSRPAPGVRDRFHFATDTGILSYDDGAAWHTINPAPVYPVEIAFHIAGAVTTGLKVPKFIAPANITLQAARAVLDSGSGATYRIYVNGAAVTGIPASAAVGTSVALNDFSDKDINAGDTVQAYISNAGSAANDLSITVAGIYR